MTNADRLLTNRDSSKTDREFPFLLNLLVVEQNMPSEKNITSFSFAFSQNVLYFSLKEQKLVVKEDYKEYGIEKGI